MEDIKMFLFAKWVLSYGPYPENGRSDDWWRERIIEYNEKIYPIHVKNGSVDKSIELFKDSIREDRLKKILENNK